MSIKCIYGGAYSFNGKLGGISQCSVEIGKTVVCFEGGLIREHVFGHSRFCTACCIRVVIQ